MHVPEDVIIQSLLASDTYNIPDLEQLIAHPEVGIDQGIDPEEVAAAIEVMKRILQRMKGEED
jgi:hypothetical protein